MTCPNCGAPTHLDRDKGLFACLYCASQFVPPDPEDGVEIQDETELRCPVCTEPLAAGLLEQRAVLYCTHCRGMLIPISDFAGLIEALRSYRDRPAVVVPPRDPYGDPPVRQCPRCTRSMDNHFYGGGGNVRVDTCEPCGELWLDKAELRRITNAPDYSYQTPLYTNYSRSSDEAGEDGHQRQSESIVETIADLFGK